MANEPPPPPFPLSPSDIVIITTFFARNNLPPSYHLHILNFLTHHYALDTPSLSPSQGLCSLTYLIDQRDKIIQFRPPHHAFDLRITRAAKDVFGSLAPETRFVGTVDGGSGLLVYEMERLRGVSFAVVRNCISSSVEEVLSHDQLFERRKTLCMDLARLLARSWEKSKSIRSNTSMSTRTSDTMKELGKGKIGLSLRSRLELLGSNLPPRFRPRAKELLLSLPQIEALPWVLTHGDLISSNIMIHPDSWHLIGLVDWAEAEVLPFGISLYGLEEILGEMTEEGFVYCEGAERLRDVFWRELEGLILELSGRELGKVVRGARDLGVLLWYGIAFDDGAVDRVVKEGRVVDGEGKGDWDEIRKLDAFLGVDGGSCTGDAKAKI